MKPLAPSRGFSVEAGHEDRARADACCAEFNARLATHAPRPPQDDGTACDESGTVATASSLGSWCLLAVVGVIVVAAWWRLLS